MGPPPHRVPVLKHPSLSGVQSGWSGKPERSTCACDVSHGARSGLDV